MRIRKNDNVTVIAGKDKGKQGKVIQSFPRLEKVVVEGVNMINKHFRTRRKGEKGQKVSFAGPIATAKVMLLCPKCAKPTRVGIKIVVGERQKKVRVCKKCKEVIE